MVSQNTYGVLVGINDVGGKDIMDFLLSFHNDNRIMHSKFLEKIPPKLLPNIPTKQIYLLISHILCIFHCLGHNEGGSLNDKVEFFIYEHENNHYNVYIYQH